MQPLEPSGRPWTDIQVDFMSGFPVSNEGHDSVAVVIDRFSKQFHVVPTSKTLTAPEFADMFIENVFRHHGLPETIVSDRDSLFTSSFWQDWAKAMTIRLRMSSPYHPQTDGLTERQNRTL